MAIQMVYKRFYNYKNGTAVYHKSQSFYQWNIHIGENVHSCMDKIWRITVSILCTYVTRI